MVRYRNTFDTPGELSAQLACSPYTAHKDEDVPGANIESMDLPYTMIYITDQGSPLILLPRMGASPQTPWLRRAARDYAFLAGWQ